ncbi:hypothetical protein HWV62_41078 [Athelia sp. TMB]|nr:hypothetical protein HWV62_41078 [Athelia sp. TMB]
MDRCPTELLHLIFSYACTDGGFTGRSLSAVSRHIHECSKPFNLQSVALHGTRQTLAFATALKKIPVHLRQVRHLFISNDEVDGRDIIGSEKPAEPSVWGVLTSFAPFSRRTTPTPEQERARNLSRVLDSDLDLAQALLTVLVKISTSLQTLAITFECHWVALRSPGGMANMATLELPNLTELSLAYRAPTDAAFNEFVFRAPLSFPALERLDLSGLKLLSYRFTPQLCDRLRKMAPNLTHLHIPTRMALANIFQMLPPGQDVIPPNTNIFHLSPTIQRVLVALSGQNTYICSDGDGCDCWRCQLLDKVAPDSCIVVLEGRGKLTWQKLKDQVEVDWENRASGGDGCWNESSAASKYHCGF